MQKKEAAGGRMFSATIWRVLGAIALCGLVAAASTLPEPRSGIWAARGSGSESQYVYVLNLTVARVRNPDGLVVDTFDGSMYGFVPYANTPGDRCSFTVRMPAADAAGEISGDCAKALDSKSAPSRIALKISRDGQSAEATWWRDDQPTVLQFARLLQNSRSRFEGDWVCGKPGGGMYSVLHVYGKGFTDDYPAVFRDLDPDYLVATLDVTAGSSNEGSYGSPVGLGYSHGGDSIDLGTALWGVTGKIDDKVQRITLDWIGHCSIFFRVPAPQ